MGLGSGLGFWLVKGFRVRVEGYSFDLSVRAT